MKKNAFTLIELSIVLVIIGLIIGGSFKVLKSMRENAKITNAKNDVQTAKNAVLGYAMTAGLLPTKTFFESDLSPIKANQHQLLYARDTTFDTTNICAFTTTLLSVQVDDRNGTSHTIPNVAFVIASESANKNLQTAIASTVVIRKPFESIDDEPTPINRVEEYDDIVDWVTLNELKNELKCENVVKLITNHIPMLDENISKEVEIFTDDYEANDYNWSIKLKNTLSPLLTSSIKYLCDGTPSSTPITATGWSAKEECTSFILDINFTTSEPSNRVDINVSKGPNSALRSYAIGLR